MNEINKRFSENTKKVIAFALKEAGDGGHGYVGTEHLLLGILRSRDADTVKILESAGVDYPSVRSRVESVVGFGCKTNVTTDDLTPVARRVLLRSSFVADASSGILPGHLLVALMREDCVAVRIISAVGADTDSILESAEQTFCDKTYNVPLKKPTPILDANALDLTEKAKNFGVDPVVGREKEEERLINILLRRSKNNPILVGDAGVGKTAVVESLASRIVKNNVPPELRGKRIMSLELSSAVAGTKYRGEFEDKIRNIIEEVRESGDVILFIDEIHTIIGAGGAEGAIDASNIFKPALARGEIKVIGATTTDEYRKTIERDAALSRRFQKIDVDEPTESVCIGMLKGLRRNYEQFHGVIIEDTAVKTAVTLSKRYITDKSLPDKAIDLIDEACAKKKLSKRSSKKPTVTSFDIAAVTELRTGVPISDLTTRESDDLLALESNLRSRIIGQDEALKKLSDAVIRLRSGVRLNKRPGGSFLFIGDPGVGKTETAKALSGLVFKSEKAFLRLDMSEYSEPNSVSKLIGSPPGYVGYGEKNALTDRIKRTPFSLVLFDEIEKSHPDVRALLLQILDEGFLTDSLGEKVLFSNTFIIMTSNRPKNISVSGFTGEGDKNLSALALSPELADRVDEVLFFRSLDEADRVKLAESKLKNYRDILLGNGFDITFSPDFAAKAVNSFKRTSARQTVRELEKLVSDLVSRAVLCGDVTKKDKAEIFYENGLPFCKIKQISY